MKHKSQILNCRITSISDSAESGELSAACHLAQIDPPQTAFQEDRIETPCAGLPAVLGQAINPDLPCI